MSMDLEAFSAMADAIQEHLGCGEDFACECAAYIGDTPFIEDGQILVRDDKGTIIARIPESVFYDEE